MSEGAGAAVISTNPTRQFEDGIANRIMSGLDITPNLRRRSEQRTERRWKAESKMINRVTDIKAILSGKINFLQPFNMVGPLCY